MIDLEPIYEVPRANSRRRPVHSTHRDQQRGSALFNRTDTKSGNQPPHIDNSGRQPACRTRFPVIPADGLKLASPWENYEQKYRLRFGSDFYVICAQSKLSPCDEVIVRTFSDTFRARFHLLQELRHPNLLKVVDAFYHDKDVYVFSPHMEVSLYEIAMVGISSIELAAILGQVDICVPTTCN
jgi:hypothetical protein